MKEEIEESLVFTSFWIPFYPLFKKIFFLSIYNYQEHTEHSRVEPFFPPRGTKMSFLEELSQFSS